MKFFTREWASCTDEEKSEKIITDYKKFISSDDLMIKKGIAIFHKNYDLRGSLVDTVKIHSVNKIIEASFITGSENRGYYITKITYKESVISGIDCKIDCVLNDRRTKIWYDEFDSFINHDVPHTCHRILLTPIGELEIQFDSINIEEIKISSRTFTTPIAISLLE